MASRLPRTRPSRNRPRLIGMRPTTREDVRLLQVRYSAEERRLNLAIDLEQLDHRLDRDPNGYAIVKPNVAIVARCPNLDAVEAWLCEHRRGLEPDHE